MHALDRQLFLVARYTLWVSGIGVGCADGDLIVHLCECVLVCWALLLSMFTFTKIYVPPPTTANRVEMRLGRGMSLARAELEQEG